jgi:dimethylamine monooxygenase subunit A
MGGPAVYIPVKESYDMKPNYFPLGKDFGNGIADSQLFQIDDQFQEYREAKSLQRQHLERYVQATPDCMQREGKIAEFMIDRLVSEHPSCFRWVSDGFSRSLDCSLTGETLRFDKEFRLIEPRYRSSLDALGMQMQEDFAILTVGEGRNWLSYIHVNFPSGWRPQEMIGKDFLQIHHEVPDMEQVKARSQQMLETFLARDISNMRFLWLTGFGDGLNRHPEKERPKDGELYLRIERQGFIPIPAAESFLFTIRIYRYPCEMLSNDELERMHTAMATMNARIRDYKGPDSIEQHMRAIEQIIQRRS